MEIMRLKEFFQSLVAHNQNVEIYFKEDTNEAFFGFKINDIDSEKIEFNDTVFSILDEINNAFLDSDLVDNGEGDTSYLLKPDLSCIKIANYFAPEYDQFWIENNKTAFDFGNNILPFDFICIQKNLNTFKIYEEKTLENIITKEFFEKFVSFYKELLNEFQEMEIELKVEKLDENNTICNIISMNGSYEEHAEFSLLDSSKFDVSKIELNTMLIKQFKIDSLLVTQILDDEKEKI